VYILDFITCVCSKAIPLLTRLSLPTAVTTKVGSTDGVLFVQLVSVEKHNNRIFRMLTWVRSSCKQRIHSSCKQRIHSSSISQPLKLLVWWCSLRGYSNQQNNKL